ncbi:hypothetical protein CMI37_38455 [Candidatus Pacearchaeota archaeon]|nr:hypothetical protein [Candidatus Pacearchaeota archaeon]|tara:strand:+ start:3251 stop:3445 length:195 start_codon:yes stop_codon:yes gene_type:complete
MTEFKIGDRVEHVDNMVGIIVNVKKSPGKYGRVGYSLKRDSDGFVVDMIAGKWLKRRSREDELK